MPAVFARVPTRWMGIAAIALIATGCGPKKPPPPPVVHIGFVAGANGFGDRGANDAARAALVQCNRETAVSAETAVPESDTDAEAKLVLFATEKFDTIIAIGYEIAPALQAAARRFEAAHFVLIDALAAQPNVQSITFDEAQGAFLAGALAARVSRTHHIAFIGGADVPLLVRSEAGFTAGAREIDPHVDVTVRYLHSFEDEAAAQTAARAELANGADILFVVAGPAGRGAFAAVVQQPHAYAIGADTDQDAIAPGKVLTSVVKHIDTAVLRVCRQTVAGKVETGNSVLGVAGGGIGLTDFRYTRAIIGAATIARVDAIAAALSAGRIRAPATRAALARFTPVPIP
jgi:basic membrane protein A